MIDSTARAERIDTSSAASAVYLWQVPQKPASVRLPLDLIDRMEQAVVDAFRSLTSRGSEVGGLLFGTVAQGSPSVVTVDDYELIPCDYSRGPLFRLSDADMGRFEQTIEQRQSNGLKVVGFFRSHTRKGLALDAEDLAFFEPRFHGGHQIALLIRPFATKASVAAIFIRENGRIASETSYQEFQFRSSELVPGRKPAEKPASGSASSAPVMADPVPPPKPQTRAQIVPIASRREVNLAEPPVAPPPPPVPIVTAPAPVIEPAPAPAPAPPLEKPAPVATPKEAPLAAEVVKEREPVKEKAAESVAAPAVSPEPVKKPEPAKIVEPAKVAAPEVEPEAPAGNKKLRLIVAAALGMIVLVGGGLFVYPALRRPAPASTTANKQDSSQLSLRVEKTTGGMLLTWNKESAAIKNATKVVLSITDGERHENIELDPNQARTGNVVYPPITGDVSFQMEVTDAKQTKTASESIRILDPRPSPLVDPSANAPKAAATSAAVPPIAKPETTEAAPAEPGTQESEVSKPVVPTRSFDSKSLANRLRPATSTDLLAAPPAVGGATAVPGSLSGIVNTPAAVAPAAPAAVGRPGSAAGISYGGQIVPAEPIYKKPAEYPKMARQAGAQGVVEIEATIGADGRVKDAKATKGNPMLQKAAVEAVLQWRYKPAMLNGKPVESPVQIRLNFVPGQ